MWIFGYGSLVWKVDFPYVKKVIGYIKGYERKFWQASIDHRGVPEKPGRVVTLIPSADPESKVWGSAYKIHRGDIPRVVDHLDHREVMGYEKIPIEFYPVTNHPQNVLEPASPFDYNNPVKNSKGGINGFVIPTAEDFASDNDSNTTEIAEGSKFTVFTYYGSSENDHFLGPAPLADMAKQIHEAIGPSGKNKEYLFNLATAMKQICEEALDTHLAHLEDAVRDLEINYNLRSPGTPMEL